MIQPIRYLSLLEGKSSTHLIQFDDGKSYAVKFLRPSAGKMLANEWLGYCLARYLQLPVPASQIVHIPRDFCQSVPKLAADTYATYQFASCYLENCVNGIGADIRSIVNRDALAGIILFDYWLYNTDRTRKNILLRPTGPGVYRLWIIDHAELFGSLTWTTVQLAMLPAGIMRSATHRMLASFVEDERDFYDQLAVIQAIPRLMIEEILSFVPDDWQLSPEERSAIVSTLLTRRQKTLPHLLQRFLRKVYRPIRQAKANG